VIEIERIAVGVVLDRHLLQRRDLTVDAREAASSVGDNTMRSPSAAISGA
jgi:hypothetical protein